MNVPANQIVKSSRSIFSCASWLGISTRNNLFQKQYSAWCLLKGNTIPPKYCQNSRALHSTAPVYGSYTAQRTEDSLQISDGQKQTTFSYIWLRDHCKSERYYNFSTNQRKNARLDFNLDIKPKDVDVCDSKLVLKWPDSHTTEYDIDWLIQHGYPHGQRDTIKKSLWNKDSMISIPVVDIKNYMSDNGLEKHLRNLLEFGISAVTGVDATEKATEEVCKQLCYIQHTMYGAMWTFTADESRQDTAFTNEGLKVHTDNTYLHSTAGIQVFHCLEHTGSGGETLLVDGFKAADNLHKGHPDAFNYLSKAIVPHENKDALAHPKNSSTVISVNPVSDELQQIRFNPYDRTTLNTIPSDEHRLFYDSYNKLTDEMLSEINEVKVKLKPGMVVFIDNWRVLHGRTGFDGRRIMCGCYLPWDDWIGRSRLLGLI